MGLSMWRLFQIFPLHLPVNPGPSVTPGTGTTTQNTLKGITLSKTELSLTPGTRQRIYVQKEPSSGKIDQTVFTSTDKTVANVSRWTGN